jgi:hypothetical protein
LHPSQMDEAAQANEFRGWFHAFERLGVTLLFSDNPPAVTMIPVSMASGVALAQACNKLGRDLLAYSGQLAQEQPAPVAAMTAPAGDDRISRMEAMVMALAAKLGSGGDVPQQPHRFVDDGAAEPAGPANRGVNHQFTQPVAGEHAPAPVQPRVMSGKS